MTTSGVEYITNSKRPYPEWLRSHTVFKENTKIDKVFPKVGLPNFREPCDIMNSQEALSEGTKLVNRFITELQTSTNKLYDILAKELAGTSKDRNDNCAKYQSVINLLNSVVYSLQYNDYGKVIDGKVVLRLRSDIFQTEKVPIFRKDEAILRVMGKIWDMLSECKLEMKKIDQYQEFKDFSRVNIPNKKYNIVFSASGEDGAWDIGTISMRGVTSCQSWNAPQSRGLIGSISSKFVGVIYVESDQNIPGYGSKMLNRALVRFAINKTTKKPALLVDRMYPNANVDTLRAFKKVLNEKSGLEVLSTFNETGGYAENNIGTNYYIPDEPSRKHLKQGEFSYMDFAIPVQQHAPSIKKISENITSLTDNFKKSVMSDLSKMVSLKREVYLSASKTLENLKAAYDEAKKKWEQENINKPEGERSKFDLVEPKLDPELNAFGKGGVMNLFAHCDKKHGANSAGNIFAKLILDSVEVDNSAQIFSKEEYHRKYLMTFLKNSKSVKEIAKKKFNGGSWMKSFPRSGERFFEFAFSQMKGYFLSSVKELIKKSN